MPKVSADGLTYTIPLRQGVIFHDDTPFKRRSNGIFLAAVYQKMAAVRLSCWAMQ
jgi:hypothetical protein